MLLPRQIQHRRVALRRISGDHRAARAGQAVIVAGGIAHLLGRPADELIHIARIVGEQHKRLEMLYRGAGVVAQARQREVGAQRVEVRQRENRVRVKQAVGGFIADLRQLGSRKIARNAGAHGAVQRQIGAVNHVRVGDLLAGRADLNFNLILFFQHR